MLPLYQSSERNISCSRCLESDGLSKTASWEELLLYLVPSWHEKGTQLATLKWPDNQMIKKDKIEKVPSWNEKGTQLLRKKVWYIIGILSLSTQPVGLHKMMECFDYKNEKTFRDNYIKPLREAGFISMTIPQKPTNSDNKYIITEEGKAFLSDQSLLNPNNLITNT